MLFEQLKASRGAEYIKLCELSVIERLAALLRPIRGAAEADFEVGFEIEVFARLLSGN